MEGFISVGPQMGTTISFSGKLLTSAGESKVERVQKGVDLKLQRIINKFKAGKRLTAGELAYLASHAPEIYKKVQRIMQKREQLEERLEAAETKEEAQQIMMQEMQSVEQFCNNSDDDFEKTALVNQMMDAYNEVTKSSSYKEKPDSVAEMEQESQTSTLVEMFSDIKKEDGETTENAAALGREDSSKRAAAADTSGVTGIQKTSETYGLTYTAGGKMDSPFRAVKQRGRKVDVAL